MPLGRMFAQEFSSEGQSSSTLKEQTDSLFPSLCPKKPKQNSEMQWTQKKEKSYHISVCYPRSVTGLENLGINKEGINDNDDDDVMLNNNCIFISLGINRKWYALLVTSMKGLNSLVVIQCSLLIFPLQLLHRSARWYMNGTLSPMQGISPSRTHSQRTATTPGTSCPNLSGICVHCSWMQPFHTL